MFPHIFVHFYHKLINKFFFDNKKKISGIFLNIRTVVEKLTTQILFFEVLTVFDPHEF